jgi:hypothetical protein
MGSGSMGSIDGRSWSLSIISRTPGPVALPPSPTQISEVLRTRAQVYTREPQIRLSCDLLWSLGSISSIFVLLLWKEPILDITCQHITTSYTRPRNATSTATSTTNTAYLQGFSWPTFSRQDQSEQSTASRLRSSCHFGWALYLPECGLEYSGLRNRRGPQSRPVSTNNNTTFYSSLLDLILLYYFSSLTTTDLFSS